MTIPVPVMTDPMADAAVHIRNFAEAVESAVAAGAIAVYPFVSGKITLTSDGSWGTTVGSGIKTIQGVIAGPVYFSDTPTSYDGLYIPAIIRDSAQTANLWLNLWDAPSKTRKANKKASLCGLVWGSTSLELDRPTPKAAPGDLFPPGVTAHGIHYPGTDDAQFRTAEAISTMADDIGAALGGVPLGLTIVTWVGSITTDSLGNFRHEFPANQISKLRGAVITAIDPTGGNKQSRMFNWYPPQDGVGDPNVWPRTLNCNMYTNQYHDQANNNLYSKIAANSTSGVSVVAWGDPPAAAQYGADGGPDWQYEQWLTDMRAAGAF